MRKLWAVARNTIRETTRSRFWAVVVVFALLMIGASVLAGSISLGQDKRVIIDFSLTFILIFLLVMTVFVGTQTLNQEIEQRTIYLALTKPISRDQFYLGKFVGLCVTTALSAMMMGALFLAVLYLKTKTFELVTLWAIGGLIVEVWLLTALGLLLASFTTPLASTIYTLTLTLIGHASLTIWTIAQKSPAVTRGLLTLVYYIFPNLEKFNFRNEVVYNLHPDGRQLAFIGLYFVAYTGVLLIAGLAVFRRHEF